ncbi:MAG: DUF3501 family protein [Rhodospirillaceae bacterium]|jgi:hypothetical protein|nr:DUF3501 family protein [Rhodospirillaceae bacterium]MBT5191899.1 DUF3501 family protein [Rhodospirillaceae bacterium]MBT5896857.1 DUF3501 family protein [Rhodospirillaceae bacterium]MBT6428326.1 DUF3501 family protein [Rhodospirillaceae bacterium]MBT7758704.1 DUF3501 family protein [Rhodospirillaceae bacterium]
MSAKRSIQREDIIPLEVYGPERPERRRAVIAMKRPRRMDVGPVAALYFENYVTMLSQIQEMLWIEKGGEAQIADELAAYNPLIPQGGELVATLMFEIADPLRREQQLAHLGGVEHTVSLEVGGEKITAQADVEDGIERTRADGKTSSIHFLHFPFTAAQITAFRQPGARIIAAIDHGEYAHMAVLPEATRQSLAEDFD